MLIKYKGGIYKRVDASSEVVEKLQSLIEKRLKAAVELLKVRGLRFGFGKEQVKKNLIAFYVTITWSSSDNLTIEQKDEVKDQLDHLLLRGLQPLESMQMFKNHHLRVYSQRWNGNKLTVAMLNPDDSKEPWGQPVEQSIAINKKLQQYSACIQGIRALHTAVKQLVKEEDSFNGTFEKNIGEISAIAPRLAAELKQSFAGLSKTAKEANTKLEKALSIEKVTDYFDHQDVEKAIKSLQAL